MQLYRAPELSGLGSVAVCETLYAEVDMTGAVVDLVRQGPSYSDHAPKNAHAMLDSDRFSRV